MPHIRHELVIGASAKKIYDAITSQEGLSAWWTANTMAVPEIDSIARFGFGEEYFKKMKILELQSSRRVRWQCIAGAEEWIGTAISFELESGEKETLLNFHPELKDQIQQQQNSDEQTLVIFRHDDWKEYTKMFAECNYTWGRFLRSLKLFCETGKGLPWPNQHRTQS